MWCQDLSMPKDAQKDRRQPHLLFLYSFSAAICFIGMSDGAGAHVKRTEQISLRDFPHHLQTLGTEVKDNCFALPHFATNLCFNLKSTRKNGGSRKLCTVAGTALTMVRCSKKKREPSDEHFATSIIGQILRINIERAICMGCAVSPCIN